MKASDLIEEIQKAVAWAGGGDPDVVVDGYAAMFSKVDNGRVWIETACADMQREIRNLEQQISDAEGEADDIVDRARQSAEEILDSAISDLTSARANL